MSNLAIWDKLARPPKDALKAISGGRLNGKTDINPQWRMKAVTEQFGPCGHGWRYTIDKLWTEDGALGERMAFALVSLYTRQIADMEAIASDGTIQHAKQAYWSEPIPGIGGSMMIANENKKEYKDGNISGTKIVPYNSDEAYKMAVTDALSVAFKSLGVAAEIYLGNWDGSKYRDQQPEPPKPEARPAAKPEPKPEPTGAQAECRKLSAELGISEDEKRKMWADSGENWSNLLVMLKAKAKERDEKVAAMDKTLSDVFDAAKVPVGK